VVLTPLCGLAVAALEELGADETADDNDEPNDDGHEQLVHDVRLSARSPRRRSVARERCYPAMAAVNIG